MAPEAIQPILLLALHLPFVLTMYALLCLKAVSNGLAKYNMRTFVMQGQTSGRGNTFIAR